MYVTLSAAPACGYELTICRFVSTRNSVYAYSYDANARNITSNPQEIITAMDNNGHVTRTLFVHENYILVSAGSEGNIDPKATEIDTGHSVIKSFDLNEAQSRTGPYKFPTEGTVLGWGLRNSVGLTVDPRRGGIWSVENSIDDFKRDGKTVSEDNPGEELNFLGYVNDTLSVTGYVGRNYGYPSCVAVWDVESLPDNQGLQVGDQILVDDSTAKLANNDTDCRNPEKFTPPRLTFQAHMAPLDVHFNNYADKPEIGGDGDLWVTFHGSWDRNLPVGYKLSKIPFDNGTGVPVAKATDKQNYEDIMWNNNLTKCGNNECFRPVGVVVDRKGRVWLGSDATGEVFVLWRNSSEGGNNGGGGGGGGGKNHASNTTGRLWVAATMACFLGVLFMQ